MENIVCIADEKSITKAAEKRFVTQSALNQQLQKLEAELGAPLFIRARSNWQPTEAGKAYLSAARQMLLLKKDAYNRISIMRKKAAVIWRWGSSRSAAWRCSRQFIRRFTAHIRKYRWNPVECHVTVMQRMITAGSLDLGLATLTEQQRDENVYHLLAEEEILLAVPADHPLAAGGSADYRIAPEMELAEFADQPLCGSISGPRCSA